MPSSPESAHLGVVRHGGLDEALDTLGENPGPRPLPALKNPYHPGRPIDNRECFYGRAYEVRTALSLLANLQSISVVGPRRIGKTSFLRYLSDPLVLEEHAVDPSQFVFTFISCAELNDLSRVQILQLMLDHATRIVMRTGFQGDERGSLVSDMTFFDFSTALESLTKTGGRLVFLFDEFEYLAHNRSLDPAFFAGLRSIASNLSVAYVTASTVSLLDLTYANSMLGSPFFNIFSPIRLGLFDDRDAKDLIANPARSEGIGFSEATVEHILSLADHHPFFIQVACFHAFETQSQKGSVSEGDLAALHERVDVELRDHFRSAWGHLEPDEKRALLYLDTAQDDPANQAILRSLEDRCLVQRDGSRWILLCDSWADFVRAQTLQVSLAAPRDQEMTAAKIALRPDLPEACTVSLQLSASRQITVEVEGAASYVPDEPSVWEASDEEIALLTQAANQLYNTPKEEWRIQARRIGEKLYGDIVGARPEIRDAFSLGLGQRRPQDMHIRFRVPRDYLALPLEMLHDGKDWLALKHPVSKFITGEQVRRRLLSEKLRRGEELRALLIAANVSGNVVVNGTCYSLDVLGEVDNEIEEVLAILQRATADLGVQLRPRVLRGEEAAYQELRRELKIGGYDLFHYSGHASHDGEQPDGSALFLREAIDSATPTAMRAGELKSLLENSMLHFAYFSCCAGATQPSAGDLRQHDFLGIVDAAVQAGLPAVLGMRWPVSDHSARRLARAFYAALLPSGELDTALLAARQEIGRDDITWPSPVLIVQA